MAAAYVVTARLGERALVDTLLEARELAAASGGTYALAPLSRDEARASLVRAIELGPAAWVARELALTLARLEYGAGLEHARSRSFYRAFYAEEARREEMRGL